MVMNNSNEMLAQIYNGMEGTGNHFVINGESADNLLKKEQVRQYNQKIDQFADKLNSYNQVLKDQEGKLEIMPMFTQLLIKPFEQNPFQKIKVSDSGVITDLGGFAPQYKSNETGQIEEEQQYIRVGTVLEIGTECKFVKPGDIVFYTVASECPVPFYKQGLVVVSELRIMAVVNSNLTERKNSIKNG